MTRRKHALHTLGVVLTLVSSLVLGGCDSGGNGGSGTSTGGGGGGATAVFNPATTSDLANRSFTFANGVSQNLAARFGLPVGQSFTLQFGNFTGATGPMTFESNGQTASGTVTIGSCMFQFIQSNFRTGQGPQGGTQVTADPCEVEAASQVLRLTDPQSRETVTSLAGVSLARLNTAFVISTDFSTGSYSTVELATRNVTRDIRRGGVHSDSIARFFNGRIYVVNRLGADNIQIIDPAQNFTTPPNGQVSMGNGSNPQDIAFVNANKAYVSRLASPRLTVINPTTLALLGEVDLSSRRRANDTDGSPDPAYMLVHNGLLYVVLQHIDFRSGFPLTKVASGEVVVIDPATDTIVTVLSLNATNPISELAFSPTLRRILVSCVGDFGVTDGGIVAIDPATNTVVPGFAVTETALGGDITAFAIVSSMKAFAIVSDANFANSLVTFNPSTGQQLSRVLGPLNVFVPHMAVNSRNELYLAVADTRTPNPGIRIFHTVTDQEITSTPLNVGQLPPIFTLFIE